MDGLPSLSWIDCPVTSVGRHEHAVNCFDSITQVPAALRGNAVLAASHGGRYVAGLALQLGLGGLIVSDAGIGRERAGIAGLDLLDERDVPAAAIPEG
jgi:hypothetical protein